MPGVVSLRFDAGPGEAANSDSAACSTEPSQLRRTSSKSSCDFSGCSEARIASLMSVESPSSSTGGVGSVRVTCSACGGGDTRRLLREMNASISRMMGYVVLKASAWCHHRVPYT